MPVQGDGGLLDKGVQVHVSGTGTPNLANRKPGGPKIGIRYINVHFFTESL